MKIVREMVGKVCKIFFIFIMDKEKFCDTEICMGFFKALIKASTK